MSTLYCVGNCANPWSGDNKEEIRRLTTTDPKNPMMYRNDLWAPASDTWSAVYQVPSSQIYIVNSYLGPEPGNYSSFLGVISAQQKGSIHVLNIFSHGNEGLIAFNSRIEPKKDGEKVFLNETTAITMKLLRDIEGKTIIHRAAGSREEIPAGERIESPREMSVRLRDRFSKDGRIVFYLCNSGATGELLQEIADVFQVEARGFSSEVWCLPKVTGNMIDRRYTSRDGRSRIMGYQSLTPDITKKPKPKK